MMADAEFQQLRARFEEACLARNIKDKDGNRIPTWKDGLSSAVPVLFRPYCEWAAMIRHNLEQKGFFAPYNRAVGYEVMAEIAKNFGPSFYKIVPDDAIYDLQKTLQFLTEFDKPVSSTLRLPPMGAIETRPSITFRWRKSLLMDQNPQKDDKWMASLAWANVLEKLPLTIRCTPAVVDVKDFPTTDQFKLIDRIYEEYIQATGQAPEPERLHMVNALDQCYHASDPYAILPPEQSVEAQDIAQVNYQQAYYQSRFNNYPRTESVSTTLSVWTTGILSTATVSPVQPAPVQPAPTPAPPATAAAPAAESVEKAEDKKEDKDKGKSNDNGRNQNQQRRNNQQRPRQNNGQPYVNLADRAAREGVFKDRTDFCKYHKMFGLNSQRCENAQSCGFYPFMESKIPNVQLRPKTQQEQLMDQSKQQMQTFMVGLASTFMDTLKDKAKEASKQGENANNSTQLVGEIDVVIEVDMNDPEVVTFYMPAREESFGEIRTDESEASFDTAEVSSNNFDDENTEILNSNNNNTDRCGPQRKLAIHNNEMNITMKREQEHEKWNKEWRQDLMERINAFHERSNQIRHMRIEWPWKLPWKMTHANVIVYMIVQLRERILHRERQLREQGLPTLPQQVTFPNEELPLSNDMIDRLEQATLSYRQHLSNLVVRSRNAVVGKI